MKGRCEGRYVQMHLVAGRICRHLENLDLRRIRFTETAYSVGTPGLGFDWAVSLARHTRHYLRHESATVNTFFVHRESHQDRRLSRYAIESARLSGNHPERHATCD